MNDIVNNKEKVFHMVMKDTDGNEVNALFVKDGMSSIKSYSELPESFRNLPSNAKVMDNPVVKDNQVFIVYKRGWPSIHTMRVFRFKHEDVVFGLSASDICVLMSFFIVFFAMVLSVFRKIQEENRKDKNNVEYNT